MRKFLIALLAAIIVMVIGIALSCLAAWLLKTLDIIGLVIICIFLILILAIGFYVQM